MKPKGDDDDQFNQAIMESYKTVFKIKKNKKKNK
jgi:hypothetical protein